MEAIIKLHIGCTCYIGGASDTPQIGEIHQKLPSLSSLLFLLSRFVLTVYLITSMFPFTEGWLHAQNIGPAAQAL